MKGKPQRLLLFGREPCAHLGSFQEITVRQRAGFDAHGRVGLYGDVALLTLGAADLDLR